MDAFIGTITPVAFNFAPVGWALCDGQLLSINQNTALFSLLGTNYGGNGTTTFGLPDLRGRVAVGQGQGPGLAPVQLGETGGGALVAGASDEPGKSSPSPAYTGVNYIICLQGIYPARN
jgi:microcystin-dependent protein